MRVTWLIHLLRVPLLTGCATCSTCDMTHSPTTRAIVNTFEIHLVENGTRSRWMSHVTHMNLHLACVYECIHMCDKTRSSTARAILNEMCDTQHMWHDSMEFDIWLLIHTWHDSFTSATWLLMHMRHTSFSHGTWLILTFDMTHSRVTFDMTHSRVTWLVHLCDITHLRAHMRQN
jgi:hypothetical protein